MIEFLEKKIEVSKKIKFYTVNRIIQKMTLIRGVWKNSKTVLRKVLEGGRQWIKKRDNVDNPFECCLDCLLLFPAIGCSGGHWTPRRRYLMGHGVEWDAGRGGGRTQRHPRHPANVGQNYPESRGETQGQAQRREGSELRVGPVGSCHRKVAGTATVHFISDTCDIISAVRLLFAVIDRDELWRDNRPISLERPASYLDQRKKSPTRCAGLWVSEWKIELPAEGK